MREQVPGQRLRASDSMPANPPAVREGPASSAPMRTHPIGAYHLCSCVLQLREGLRSLPGIEPPTPRTHATSAASLCSCLRSRSSNSLWDMIPMPR
jgi:hypothetical protein